MKYSNRDKIGWKNDPELEAEILECRSGSYQYRFTKHDIAGLVGRIADLETKSLEHETFLIESLEETKKIRWRGKTKKHIKYDSEYKYLGRTNKMVYFENGNGDRDGALERFCELIDENPKQLEAEILDEIEVDSFKRMIRKLKLRKECGMVGCKPKTSIVLTYDGEILDKIEIE